MRNPIPSKLPTHSGRKVSFALLVSCIALPVLLSALPGCGGEAGDSHIGAASSSSTARAGAPDIFVPVTGGMGNGTGSTGNGTGGAGPYKLPADYTEADMGGFKLGAAVDVGMAGAPGAAGAPSMGCGTAILGVVRDFKGKNVPGGHPDFETYAGSDASEGIVKATLGDDKKPVYNGTGPIVDARNGQQTTSKMDFDQWYRATANVNKPYQVFFYFEPNGDVLTFQSQAFFPLDDKGWGNTCHEAGATCQKWEHNFGFTTEIHTQFNYKGGETFSFTGDDDLWVFINGKLAIDLGGLHRETTKKILLDTEAKKLGIIIGQNYDLDLFHAERHTNASNFRVDTNLAFINCGTIIDEPPPK
jgi:fibro-slime domain-containing protein